MIVFFFLIFSFLNALPDYPGFLKPEKAENFIQICKKALQSNKEEGKNLFKYILKKLFKDKHDEFFPKYQELPQDDLNLSMWLEETDDYCNSGYLYEAKYSENEDKKYILLLSLKIKIFEVGEPYPFIFLSTYFKDDLNLEKNEAWFKNHNNSIYLPNSVFSYIKSNLKQYLKELEFGALQDSTALDFISSIFVENKKISEMNLRFVSVKDILKKKFSFKENRITYELMYNVVFYGNYEKVLLFYHLFNLENDKAAFLKLYIGEKEYKKLLMPFFSLYSLPSSTASSSNKTMLENNLASSSVASLIPESNKNMENNKLSLSSSMTTSHKTTFQNNAVAPCSVRKSKNMENNRLSSTSSVSSSASLTTLRSNQTIFQKNAAVASAVHKFSSNLTTGQNKPAVATFSDLLLNGKINIDQMTKEGYKIISSNIKEKFKKILDSVDQNSITENQQDVLLLFFLKFCLELDPEFKINFTLPQFNDKLEAHLKKNLENPSLHVQFLINTAKNPLSKANLCFFEYYLNLNLNDSLVIRYQIFKWLFPELASEFTNFNNYLKNQKSRNISNKNQEGDNAADKFNDVSKKNIESNNNEVLLTDITSTGIISTFEKSNFGQAIQEMTPQFDHEMQNNTSEHQNANANDNYDNNQDDNSNHLNINPNLDNLTPCTEYNANASFDLSETDDHNVKRSNTELIISDWGQEKNNTENEIENDQEAALISQNNLKHLNLNNKNDDDVNAVNQDFDCMVNATSNKDENDQHLAKEILIDLFIENIIQNAYESKNQNDDENYNINCKNSDESEAQDQESAEEANDDLKCMVNSDSNNQENNTENEIGNDQQAALILQNNLKNHNKNNYDAEKEKENSTVKKSFAEKFFCFIAYIFSMIKQFFQYIFNIFSIR